MIDCLIAGAGLAGLSAATALADKGASLLVLEALPQAGGRARSLISPLDNQPADTGQHLMLGCYSEVLSFLHRIGAEEGVRRIRHFRIPFLFTDRNPAVLVHPRLPHPLSLPAGLLGFRALSLQEKVRAMSLLWILRSNRSVPDIPAREWLLQADQPQRLIHILWEPLTLATLNLSLDEAPARLLAVVLATVFTGVQGAADLLLVKEDLSQLYVHPALNWLSHHCVEVRLHEPLRSLIQQTDGTWICHLRAGEPIHARSVILAMPPDSTHAVLEASKLTSILPVHPGLRQWSPIISARILTSRSITTEPLTACIGTQLQWIFDKGQDSQGRYVTAAVISSASHLITGSVSDIQMLIKKDLASLGREPGHILGMHITKEKRATPRLTRDLLSHRPGPKTAIPGLVLAGDWTNTGLPATLESAAKSGHAAAAVVMRMLGNSSI